MPNEIDTLDWLYADIDDLIDMEYEEEGADIC